MKTTGKLFHAAFMLIVLTSCTQNKTVTDENSESLNQVVIDYYEEPIEEEAILMEDQTAFLPPVVSNSYSKENSSSPEKLIRDIDVSYIVPDHKVFLQLLQERVKQFNARIIYHYYSNYGTSEHSLEIKIPTDKADAFMSSVEKSEGIEIRQFTSKTQNVTKRYYEAVSLLSTKKAYLQRYQELLKRANSIKEILEIEERIRPLVEEINGQTSTLNRMDERIEEATIEIQFSEKEKAHQKDADSGNRLWKSTKEGWKKTNDFFFWTVTKWPQLIILSTGLFFSIRWFRKRKKVK